MTYRVTINKETHLGLAENPYNYQSVDFDIFEHSNSPLPVFTFDDIQVLEGEWNCEKVWQKYHFYIIGDWYDVPEPEIIDDTYRQIYKVVLPVKEEAAEMTIEQAASMEAYCVGKPDNVPEAIRKSFLNGAAFDKQQTIDKVVEVINNHPIINSPEVALELHRLITKIKELK